MELARASIAVWGTAIVVAGIDAIAVMMHPLAGLVGPAIAPAAIAVLAVHLAFAGLAMLATASLLALRRRAPSRIAALVPLASTVLLVAAATALNAGLLATRPWPTVMLLMGLLFGHAALVLALAAGRWRRPVLVGAVVVVLGLLVVDGWTFRGVSPRQHETLVLAAWAFAVPVGRLLAPRPIARARILATWAAIAALVGSAIASAAHATAGTRLVVHELAPAARATIGLVAHAFDLDGDGDVGLPLGRDCAPFDPAVAPARSDRPGDGIDGNCLAGDPDPIEVDELRRRIAGADQLRPQAPAARRLLLVTVDALRHDAPMAELAARLGDRCTRPASAYSTGNETTYAVHTLFTSRLSSQDPFVEVGPYHVPQGAAARLPAVLAEDGFATMAVAFHSRFEPWLGLSTGFAERWTVPHGSEPARADAGTEATDRALAWLADREPPWFLWVHYYDTHDPYVRPGRSSSDRYLAEVAHTDREIARLLDGLPALADTAIVVTADHGEAFGEHGMTLHGTDLFEEQVRVPMWICPPRGWPRAPEQPLASLLDVAPTVLDLAGVPRPTSFTGRSLVRDAVDVPVRAESIRGRRMQMVRTGDHKLVRMLDGDVRLLFDLARDPGETRDLAAEAPADLARLEALLDAWTAPVDQ